MNETSHLKKLLLKSYKIMFLKGTPDLYHNFVYSHRHMLWGSQKHDKKFCQGLLWAGGPDQGGVVKPKIEISSGSRFGGWLRP